jgi:sulfate transport system permease protein
MIVRLSSLGYLGALLVAPVSLIFWRAFAHGWQPFWSAVSSPNAVAALRLTVEVTAITVPLNTAFGVLCAIAIVRHRLPGMGVVNAIVDLPLALSPVVVGLALYLLYAPSGWFAGLPFRVLFAVPGIVLATLFISLPFVVREVVPVLREIGTEQEQAAATLGANAFTSFRRITFPAIRWAVAYGVVLTRRVRRGQHRLGRARGPEPGADAVRAGLVRELRPDRRVRGLRAARRAGDPDPPRIDGDETWRSKLVT